MRVQDQLLDRALKHVVMRDPDRIWIARDLDKRGRQTIDVAGRHEPRVHAERSDHRLLLSDHALLLATTTGLVAGTVAAVKAATWLAALSVRGPGSDRKSVV